MKSISASIGCFGFLLAVSAGAVPDGGVAPDSGANSCTTTADCAPPTSYCDTTRSVCVQCIADLNCFGVALVCNKATGKCATCTSDAQCFLPFPYCSTTANSCVECLTDGNCGKQGIKCKDGICGSCGDGICSESERMGNNGPCKDCFEGCPKINLGTKTGEGIATGSIPMGSDPFVTSCGPGPSATATFQWTAPTAGSFTMVGGAGSSISVLADDCAGTPYMCWTDQAFVSLAKGQKVAILLSRIDGTTGPYALGISNVSDTCSPTFCPTGPFGQQGCCLSSMPGACGYLGPDGCAPQSDTGINPFDVKNCMNNVAMRNEPACVEGSDCRCAHCPVTYDSCNSLSGCREIVTCMHRFGCMNGMDCYKPDRCAPTIDAYGGIGAQPYTYAAGVTACDYMSGCQDCGSSVVMDASMSGPGGQAGSGAAPASGARSGTGGHGGFAGQPGSGGVTSAVDAGVGPTAKGGGSSGGCDCNVPRGNATPSAALSALAGLLAAGVRRRRRTR